MADLAEREGARTMFLPSLVQPVDPRRDLVAVRQISRMIDEFRPHIVHTHTAKAGFAGRAAAQARRRRPVIVHTFHGHVLEGYFGKPKTLTFRSLERLLARRTDALIGVSEQTVADLVRLRVAPASKFRVIPLGLDLRAVRRGRRGQRRAAPLGARDRRRTRSCSRSSAGSCRSSASTC